MESKVQKRTLVFLTVDTGASMSKACYSICSDHQEQLEHQTHFMQMGSEMITVPQSMIDKHQLNYSSDAPENYAWIKHKAKEKNVVAIGFFAKKFQAMKQNQIHLAKYENAIEKCIAFVGSIINKHNLPKDSVDIGLSLLIPYDEFKSSELIKTELTKSIKSFYFQGMRIKSQLVQFGCYPEGYGGFINRMTDKGREWMSKNNTSVLMIGHRNCTCLNFENGNMAGGDTIRTGFHDLIKDIQRNTINQNLEDLEYIIPRIKENQDQSKKMVASLVRSRGENNKKSELAIINSAIESSREKFWNRLVDWLNTQIPNRLAELMIFGGGSLYLKEYLEKFFSWSCVYWGDDLINEINQELDICRQLNYQLCLRNVDVYGLHKYMIATFRRLK